VLPSAVADALVTAIIAALAAAAASHGAGDAAPGTFPPPASRDHDLGVVTATPIP